MAAPSRLLAAAVALTAILAAAGVAWELSRFGLNADTTAARVERDVHAIVADRSNDVESLAQRVAQEGPLIAEASASLDRLPALFDRLSALASPTDQHGIAVTVYVPDSRVGGFRVLAWSDGPGEKNLTAERLAGKASLFVAPGHAGLRLVFVDPVLVGDRRIAVAVAETVLATSTPAASQTAERYLPTSFGPVAIVEQYASTREELPASSGFVVTAASGAPLFEVHLSSSDLDARRWTFRRRVFAAAALPTIAAIGLLAFSAVQRRRRAQGWQEWLGWTSAAALAVIAAGAGLIGAARIANLDADATGVIVASVCWALAALLPSALWWQRDGRQRPRAHPARFVIEQIAAGVLLAVTVEGLARLTRALIAPSMLDEGQSVLFPFDLDGLLSLGTLLVTEVAATWTIASLLAATALRWRLPRDRGAAALAAVLWLLPAIAWLAFGATPWSAAALTRPAAVAFALAVTTFGLVARRLRKRYRRSSQAARLLLAFASVLAPLVVLYPMSASMTDRQTRHLIEDAYAPAAAQHRDEMFALITRATSEIDAIGSLPDLVSGLSSCDPQDTQAAFLIWSQTRLAQVRVTSDIELYNSNRCLVSRFALNLPEYIYRTSVQTWDGHNCGWETFGVLPTVGAQEREMLHAERGVCDASGHIIGGIVVRVASNDYQALPFVASTTPYADVFGVVDGSNQWSRIPDVTLAVYGWSFRPIFASKPVPWTMTPSIFERLYNPATPFWRSMPTDDGAYRVYFSQNRAGVYALGYPAATLIDHATRLAEIAALAAMLFVALQLAAVLYAPLTHQPQAPLRVLLHEIRASFYRKLFLVFVAVAVVPVLASALAFGGYMNARFHADVEAEAAGTVTVARRVFEELYVASGRSADARAPLPDDVMVWIRQVINQDVNLYDGSELSATSQRDLFDSGLLPTRTPASVYRAVALDRRPTFLAEDSIGNFQYEVAATPVVTRGRDSILTVPLAPRQREIAREIDVLYRRVLVGAVFVVLLAAVLGASLASRVADPVARLTRATRQIAAGRLDTRITVESPDELGRLVHDFNSMAGTLEAQRAELARAHQLKAWSEMARQVAHEIKNPLTPIQLAAEHLRHVHTDRGRPLGAVLEQCVDAILRQVRLLRQIASEFSTYAAEPPLRRETITPAALAASVIDPYRLGLSDRVIIDVDVPETLPAVAVDRTLIGRALTNLIENAVQAMPNGGGLTVRATAGDRDVTIEIADTGVGMDPAALTRAFEPYFSTKTGGSGLGLANAKRHIERHGGSIAMASTPGRGTRVTLVLPQAEAPRDGDGAAAPPSR
ncbi:MAG TPA: HAMP domain-containing sensor histidine kinase [Vicinamibacterales bacterium]|nr:HAMP domain-containing sensor histidine kinase [Vicinamibacterales bacterium]